MSKSSIKARPFFRRFIKHRLETGFSMLEAVVVVAVLLALAVSGFIAYGAITDNAKKAEVKSSASEVYTAVVSANIDGDSSTKPQDVVDKWNASTDKIHIDILKVPTDANGDFCISATNLETSTITALQGDCSGVTVTPPGAGEITVSAGSKLLPGVLTYFNDSQKSLETDDFAAYVRAKANGGVAVAGEAVKVDRFLATSNAIWAKLESNSADLDQYNSLADSTDPTLTALYDAADAEWSKMDSGTTTQQKVADTNRAWLQGMANAAL